MRKTIGWFMTLILLLGFSVHPAAGEGFSREDWYKMGIAALEEISEESLGNAAECFQAAGNYGQAQNYKQYVLSLLDILALDDGTADPDTMAFRLKKISGSEEFAASLAENSLPSCEELAAYIQARRYEQEGDYYQANNVYDSISGVLDVLDRQIDLMPKIYDQAAKLYQQEQYEEAAEIFLRLSEDGWRDSAEMYQKSVQNAPHVWTEADCTHPKTCTLHGETEGEPLGHDWQEATCTEPKTCRRCGATEGTPLGHDWQEATCTEPKTCRRCGATEGDPLGHDWQETMTEGLKMCRVCGATEGDKLKPEILSITWNYEKKCPELTFRKNGIDGSFYWCSSYGHPGNKNRQYGNSVEPTDLDTVTVLCDRMDYIPGRWYTFMVDLVVSGYSENSSVPVEFQIPVYNNTSSIRIENCTVSTRKASDLEEMADELYDLLFDDWSEYNKRFEEKYAGYIRADAEFTESVRILVTSPSGSASAFWISGVDWLSQCLCNLFISGDLPIEQGTYTIEFFDDELMCPVPGGVFTFDVN